MSLELFGDRIGETFFAFTRVASPTLPMARSEAFMAFAARTVLLACPRCWRLRGRCCVDMPAMDSARADAAAGTRGERSCSHGACDAQGRRRVLDATSSTWRCFGQCSERMGGSIRWNPRRARREVMALQASSSLRACLRRRGTCASPPRLTAMLSWLRSDREAPHLPHRPRRCWAAPRPLGVSEALGG